MPTPANAYSTRPEQSKPVVPEPEPMPLPGPAAVPPPRSEEHTSELQSQSNLVCRLLLEKKKNKMNNVYYYLLIGVPIPPDTEFTNRWHRVVRTAHHPALYPLLNALESAVHFLMSRDRRR